MHGGDRRHLPHRLAAEELTGAGRAPLAIGLALTALLAALLVIHRNGEARRHAVEAWLATAPRDTVDGPMHVGVMMPHFNGGIERLPQTRPLFVTRPLPVLLSVSGCGWADDTAHLPFDIAVLTAGKQANGTWLGIDACRRRDAAALARTYRREIDAMLSAVRSRPWLDAHRVLIRGYGEAAPVVAAYDGPALARIIVGRPCLVTWTAVSTRTPVSWLHSSTPWQRWQTEFAGPLLRCRPAPAPAVLAAHTRLIDPRWLDSNGINSIRYHDALAQAYAEPLGITPVHTLPGG